MAKKRKAKVKKIKTVKKVAKAKKVSKKKIKKACSSKKPPIFKECKNSVAFILPDGRKLRSLVHLVDELETMSDDVFSSHVTEFKNDFSNWLRDVFKEDAIADELHLINDRLETQRTLLKHAVRFLLGGKK